MHGGDNGQCAQSKLSKIKKVHRSKNSISKFGQEQRKLLLQLLFNKIHVLLKAS